MKKPLLVGVTALFLVAGTAHATEYQGNLPKPVQKLPAYPPVACVAPDWSVKSCGDRQTPLPHPNPLRAFDPRPPLDMGGFAQYPIINKSNGPLQFPNAEKVEEKVPGIPYPPIPGLFRIRPEAWDRMVREWPPASRIEDRRNDPPTEITPEERNYGMRQWLAIRRGIDPKEVHPSEYDPLYSYRRNYEQPKEPPPLPPPPNALRSYRKEWK